MAARALAGTKRGSCRFSSVLSSAIREWLLIFLLFLDAFFSYLVTQFACHCKLQTPCLLCSRLDHILGNEKPGFYRNLICDAHKSEILSWAGCHVHQKLANACEMCEGCLLSFGTVEKSNPETVRSLVGDLGVDLDDSENAHQKLPVVDIDGEQSRFYGEDAVHVPLLRKDLISSKPLEDKSNPITVLRSKPSVAEVSEIGSSVSNLIERSHLNHQVRESKAQEISLGTTTVYHSGNQAFERLAHIGYSELKVTSDSESEVPFSDDDDGTALVHGKEDLKKDLAVSLRPEPVIIMPDSVPDVISEDIASEKLINPTPVMVETSPKVIEKVHNVKESPDSSSLLSSGGLGHGLEELNWSQVEVKTNLPAPSETVSSEVPVEVQTVKHALTASDGACVPPTSSVGVSKESTSTSINLKLSKLLNDSGSSLHVSLDLNDAYKLAVGGKNNMASPKFTEIVTGKDSSRVHEDLRLLLSQISASRGLELPWNDMTPSPRVPGQGDEFKFSDASSSIVLQNISKRLSIERNESGLESLDGSIVSEIEGESPLGRLMRQLELDRKSMSLLYKELEEERNASAIAANQAMAMITRLQEEKAAMQMEALQYQRMMEEQAEYDQEALQKLNDLLTQREKETQDLEEEIENYRMRFGDEQSTEKQLGSFNGREAGKGYQPKAPNGNSGCYSKHDLDEVISWDSRLVTSFSKDPLLYFEDERAYISDCLKKLERKLHLYSNNGVYVDVPESDEREDSFADKVHEEVNGPSQEHGHVCSEMRTGVGHYSVEEVEENGLENHQLMDVSKENSLTGGQVLVEKSSPSPYGENQVLKPSSVLRTLDAQFCAHDGRYSDDSKESKLVALVNEITQLNERLEALEADRNFLEHTINSLRNGTDGVQFIQEIACHLRGLRRIGISRGEHGLA